MVMLETPMRSAASATDKKSVAGQHIHQAAHALRRLGDGSPGSERDRPTSGRYNTKSIRACANLFDIAH